MQSSQELNKFSCPCTDANEVKTIQNRNRLQCVVSYLQVRLQGADLGAVPFQGDTEVGRGVFGLKNRKRRCFGWSLGEGY